MVWHQFVTPWFHWAEIDIVSHDRKAQKLATSLQCAACQGIILSWLPGGFQLWAQCSLTSLLPETHCPPGLCCSAEAQGCLELDISPIVTLLKRRAVLPQHFEWALNLFRNISTVHLWISYILFSKKFQKDIFMIMKLAVCGKGFCLYPAWCLKSWSLTGRELEQYHITPSLKSKEHSLW